VTTSRRVSRKLLATALEVAFSVRVADKAAGKKLVDDKLLTKANLDAELEKQGLPKISKVVSEAKSVDTTASNSTGTDGLSAAHRAVPTHGLQMVVALLVALISTRVFHEN
jgi:hypothetical protein